MEISTETQKVQREAEEAGIWFSFFVKPEFRRFNNIANKFLLDEYLTKTGQVLSIENLAAAVAALGRKLGEREPTKWAEIQAESARQVQAEARASVEAEKAAAAAVDPTVIPSEIDRRALIKMDRDSYKELQKKYGNEAIEARLNGAN